jgi:hypothetical protein
LVPNQRRPYQKIGTAMSLAAVWLVLKKLASPGPVHVLLVFFFLPIVSELGVEESFAKILVMPGIW